MAVSYTFTDLLPPTGFGGSAVSGGTLAVNTYYYKMIAVFSDTTTPNTFLEGKSLTSSEISVTTDTANKTVRLTWDAVAGAGGYRVYRATKSGDYIFMLNVAIRDIDVNSGGICTWDDTGYLTTANNSIQDIAHGKIEIDRSDIEDTDKISIEDMYDADVSGSWGVIDKEYSTYKIKTALIIISDMTWDETSKTIYFYDSITTNKLKITFGKYDAVNDYSYNGCDIIFQTWSLNSIRFRTLNLYKTIFKWNLQYNNLIPTPLSYINITINSGNIIDSYFDRIRSIVPLSKSSVLMKRTSFFKGDNMFSTGLATFENIISMECSRSFQTGTNSIIRAEGYIGKKMELGDCLCLGSGWTVTFVDSEVTAVPFAYHSGTAVGAVGNINWSFILTVVDKNNDIISGATVTVKNSTGATVITGTTDTNGKIIDEITENQTTFSTTGVKTVTDLNPFTITISKTGYETYFYDINISEPFRTTIKLRPQKQIAITNDGVYVNTDPKNLTDTLSLIKI